MKHAIYLGLILVLLSGCRSQVAEPFPMTLIVTDKLGDKPSDKLPEDIKRLCDVFPGVDKDDTCYYASPVLVRIYGTQVIERSLVTEVSGKFAVKKSNPKFMGRSIRLNIDTMTLGEGFAKATADTAGTASAINACLAKLESPVVFYYIKSYKDSNALAKRIYNTTEALQKAMATELKTNRDAHIVVVVGKHPALKPVDGPDNKNENTPSDTAKVPPVPKDTAKIVIPNKPAEGGKHHAYVPKTGGYYVPEVPRPKERYDTVYFSKNRLLSVHDHAKRVAEEGDIVVGPWLDGQLLYGKWYTRNWKLKEVVHIGKP